MRNGCKVADLGQSPAHRSWLQGSPVMKTTSVRLVLVAGGLVAAGALALATGVFTSTDAVAQAQCVSKAGKGTGNTDDSAKFQAWEAVLQGTDLGSWGTWMVSSQTVGVAPGYKVSNLKSRCSAGGFLGRECVVGARLCKQ
jgi:hypothetical protein